MNTAFASVAAKTLWRRLAWCVCIGLGVISGGIACAQDADTGPAPLGQPAAPAAPAGQMDFQTDLFTGRFTTRVPIVVPPARGNATPNIVLGYSSGGGNGWCGVGWNLDMGFIQRDTRDGVPVKFLANGNPDSRYSDGCGFIASFQGTESRLIPLGNGAYGSEVERTFTKFTYDGQKWIAVDKAGTKYFFGSDTNSRITTRFGTFRWALDKVMDINGNSTYLSYTTDGGQLYLSQIRYNGHETGGSQDFAPTHFVDFRLEDRPDTNINCRAGAPIYTRKRLAEITVRVQTNLVRKYSLSYTNSASTIGRCLHRSNSSATTARPLCRR
jgi:hypothetical protein